eukprot:tig00020801_g13934.t1
MDAYGGEAKARHDQVIERIIDQFAQEVVYLGVPNDAPSSAVDDELRSIVGAKSRLFRSLVLRIFTVTIIVTRSNLDKAQDPDDEDALKEALVSSISSTAEEDLNKALRGWCRQWKESGSAFGLLVVPLSHCIKVFTALLGHKNAEELGSTLSKRKDTLFHAVYTSVEALPKSPVQPTPSLKAFKRVIVSGRLGTKYEDDAVTLSYLLSILGALDHDQ